MPAKCFWKESNTAVKAFGYLSSAPWIGRPRHMAPSLSCSTYSVGEPGVLAGSDTRVPRAGGRTNRRPLARAAARVPPRDRARLIASPRGQLLPPVHPGLS